MKLLIYFLFISSFLHAQNWIRVDSIFSPSGVVPQNFSAPVFYDINGDGALDLFLGSSGDRVECYIGKPNQIPPAYRKDTAIVGSIYAGGYQYTNADYPALADLNGDRKMDLVIGGYNGLIFYQNTGDTLYPQWTKRDSFFVSVNSEIGTDPRPAFVDIDGDGDLDLFVGIGESLMGGPTPGITIAFRNTGNSSKAVFTRDNTLTAGIADVGLNAYPAFADLDNDGDMDLLIGRDLQTFVYYKNVGTASAPVWQSNTLFSGVETTRYWKDPTFWDIDRDGDLDLIYGTDAGILFVYQNTGTVTAPAFQYNSAYFSVIKNDGNGATAALADYDNDGDFDLVSGNWLGKMALFRNDGTKNNPVFKLTAASFSNLSNGSYSSPVLVDLDNDGDMDLVAGNLGGKINYWVNNNGSFSANTTVFGSINVSGFSAPAFGDIDSDGDKDLLVGAESGTNSRYFQNIGNNVFAQNDSVFAGISFPSDAAPVLADIDNDGDLDLVIGMLFGDLRCYMNIGSRNKPIWSRNDTLFANVSVDQNSHPAFADLDNDGRLDLIIGEYNGNFTFYKNNFAITSVKDKPVSALSGYRLYQNYPNPFNPSTTISYQIQNTGLVSLIVYDVLGRAIRTLVSEEVARGDHSVQFSGADLPSGVYLCTLKAGDFVSTKKMILLK